jgi:hypothetical protein
LKGLFSGAFRELLHPLRRALELNRGRWAARHPDASSIRPPLFSCVRPFSGSVYSAIRRLRGRRHAPFEGGLKMPTYVCSVLENSVDERQKEAIAEE